MISSKAFVWDGPGNKTGYAEISDIQDHIVQIFPESADAGFTVFSSRTGVEKKFVETGKRYTTTGGEEREVNAYIFREMNKRGNVVPNGVTIVLWND